MQDNTADLPDGTDTVIAGASETGSDTLVAERDTTSSRGATNAQGIADRIRTGREQFATQAGDRARGIVTQGLERTSEALANVSKMVGDTAAGIEERLGPEYGD